MNDFRSNWPVIYHFSVSDNARPKGDSPISKELELYFTSDGEKVSIVDGNCQIIAIRNQRILITF